MSFWKSPAMAAQKAVKSPTKEQCLKPLGLKQEIRQTSQKIYARSHHGSGMD